MYQNPIRILEHTADIGFEVRAASLKELFRDAARGLILVAAGEVKVEPRESRSIDLNSTSLDELMVAWLNEILYLFDSGEFVPAAIDIISVGETGLAAQLRGEPRNPQRHPWELIVKGVTYHQLAVAQQSGGWYARVMLDI